MTIRGDVALQQALAQERSRQTGAVGKALQSYVYPAAAIVLLIGAWEAATDLLQIPDFLLPAPSNILREIIEKAPLFVEHGSVTLLEILLGFGVSVAVAVPLAVMITYFRTLERILYPLLVSSQTIPKVAIAPLLIVWFGFGLAPKVLMTFLIAFFPIVIAGAVGLAETGPELTYVVRSMGASPWQAFWKVRFPTALPSLFGGLKIAITLAVVGAVVAEFVGADKGLGYLILVANGVLDTRLLFAAVTVLSSLGIVLFLVMEFFEWLLLRQHRR
jgi:NitT/TauT family transport system permease protein